jgi:hypothetical protein
MILIWLYNVLVKVPYPSDKMVILAGWGQKNGAGESEGCNKIVCNHFVCVFAGCFEHKDNCVVVIS